VEEFGRALFDALLSGEIGHRYVESLREAERTEKGLRLKLHIHAPELAVLPWEFLHDPREGEYISLSHATPIIRYLELPRPPQPLTVTPPLRILGMAASPRDLTALDVAREQRRLDAATTRLRRQGLLEITWLEEQTWQALQRAMRSGPWHVFHFMGHGGFDSQSNEGLITLATEEGGSHRLSASQLGLLLAGHRTLRLALLNSCEGARGGERDIFSSTASILVRRGLSAVLAMQYEITDRAAIELTHAFYEALTDGYPVDAAVGEARKAVSLALAGTVEWGTPVLFMRSPHGVLFEMLRQPGPGSKPPGPPRWIRAWSRLQTRARFVVPTVAAAIALVGVLLLLRSAPVPVASVEVRPAADSLQPGAHLQLVAKPLDARGSFLPDRGVVWTSSDSTVASVSAGGLVVAYTVGETTVTGESGGQVGKATIKVLGTLAWKKAWITIQDRQALQYRGHGYYAGFPSPTLTNREALLGILTRLDVTMDDQILAARNRVIRLVERAPRDTWQGKDARGEVDLSPYYDMLYSAELAGALGDLEIQIRDAAVSHGVDVQQAPRK
jgi:hypothetical protein